MLPHSPKLATAVVLASLLLSPVLLLGSETLHIGNFSASDLSGWEEKSFKGKTSYTLVREGGRTVLKAHSRASSSGLTRKIALDPGKYPLIRWSWKVGNLVRKEDIAKKQGDDFAARVYVVFPRGFFLRTRAINYVWASRMAKETAAPNPYTSQVMIVAVESGGENIGKWVSEERNIRDDYRRLFREEPPEIGAIAIMTDTDDTREEVTAWYGDIMLFPQQ